MTDLERRALLGDRQAQEECTRQGIVLPCWRCGGEAEVKQVSTVGRPLFAVSCKKHYCYKQHCASGPCATEPTDADFFCGNFEPKTQLKELATLQPLEDVGTKEGAGKNHVPGTAPERRSNER